MKKKIYLMGLLTLVLTLASACVGLDVGGNSASNATTSSTSVNESSEQQESSSGKAESSSFIDESVETESSETESKEDGSEEETVYYTVTFDTDGGNSIANVEVESGQRIEKPTDPQKSSKDCEYEFLGWYYGNEEWDFANYVVTKDTTLTARWRETEKYTQPFLPKD